MGESRRLSNAMNASLVLIVLKIEPLASRIKYGSFAFYINLRRRAFLKAHAFILPNAIRNQIFYNTSLSLANFVYYEHDI